MSPDDKDVDDKDAAVDREAERRKEQRDGVDAGVEEGPASDPRSRYGHPADWNFPRGYGGL